MPLSAAFLPQALRQGRARSGHWRELDAEASLNGMRTTHVLKERGFCGQMLGI